MVKFENCGLARLAFVVLVCLYTCKAVDSCKNILLNMFVLLLFVINREHIDIHTYISVCSLSCIVSDTF